MAIIEGIPSTIIFLILTGLGIWAIAAPTDKVSITEKFIGLIFVIFIHILFWGDVLYISIPVWIPVVFIGVEFLLFLSIGRHGDWLGRIYNFIIKPYKSIYLKLAKALIILVIFGIIISAYLIAYLTWKGRIEPGVGITYFAIYLMLIVGIVTGGSGFCGAIWNRIMTDRSEGEKQIVGPLTASVFWIGFTLYFLRYLNSVPAAIAGFLVLIYFVIAIRGYNKDSHDTLILVPVYSFIHFVSLVGAITLILHSIKA